MPTAEIYWQTTDNHDFARSSSAARPTISRGASYWARTTVAVQLAGGLKVEIECIALA